MDYPQTWICWGYRDIWSRHFMANRWGNSGNSDRLYFGGLQNHCKWYCSHEIKGFLLLGRKVITNLDSILKSRDITLPTKVHLVKTMIFPVVMYGSESWIIKKAEHWRIGAFELWGWRTLLRVPWTGGDSISPSLRKSALNIHWKDWYLSWNSNSLATWWEELTDVKRPWYCERLEAGGEGDVLLFMYCF